MNAAQKTFLIGVCIVLGVVCFVMGWRYMLVPAQHRAAALSPTAPTQTERPEIILPLSPEVTDGAPLVEDTQQTAVIIVDDTAPLIEDTDTQETPQETLQETPEVIVDEVIAEETEISSPVSEPDDPETDVLPSETPDTRNIVRNSDFAEGLAPWTYWGATESDQAYISLREERMNDRSRSYLRIENPEKKLMGVQQHVAMVSGTVYRLSGLVRSTFAHDSSRLFGGRIGVYFTAQIPEVALVWMTEYNQWLPQELVFTNAFTGVATLYAHMGYGNIASTGEFTNITLEPLDNE